MRRLHLLALLVFVAACDSGGDDARIVAGVDLDALFAPPTAAERQAVLSDWDARTPVATDYEVVREQPQSLGGTPYTARTYRYTLDGLTLYGLALVPDGAEAGSRPVVVYGSGGDDGVSLGEVATIAGTLRLPDPPVWIAPSFRDEPLSVDGSGTLQSDGPASPWDRDVDDALALIDVVLASVPAADPERVGALGISRGGGVALLMAVRDARVRRVVDFYGPTDFFGPYVQDVVTDALQGNSRNLPGFDVLNARFIQPLQRGEITPGQMRIELLRRSPALFADRLPAVQAHHGTADDVVDVEQTRALEAALAGRADAQFFYYEGQGHDVVTILSGLPRAQQFLSEL
jgi:dipeptidyl aminopeptidase/acylaminoacyl peptidase